MADTRMDELASALSNLNFAVTNLNRNIGKLDTSLKNNTKQEEGARDSTRGSSPMSNSVAQKLMATVAVLTSTMGQVATAIRSTQKELGVGVQQAAETQVKSFTQSLRSALRTLQTGGRTTPVTQEQILGAQAAFRAQFGGLITEGRARELAEQAQTLGLSAEQLAFARRTFMTTATGDLRKANIEQNKFFMSFKLAGLTNKDAMEAVERYTVLIARNGTRFAGSFAKAAADAKKMGVDLNKISQFGDSIVTDFEGFLEKTAELGAMGLSFDVGRLSEIALTGDDAALVGELQSQLAGMGKNINNLNRVEQVLISSLLGMQFDEIVRMTGAGKGTPADMGEERQTVKLDETQLGELGKLTNSVTALKNVLEPILDQLRPIAGALLALSGARMLLGRGAAATGGGAAGGAAGAGILSRLERLKNIIGMAGEASARGAGYRTFLTRGIARGGGISAGIVGAAEGFAGAKTAGLGTTRALGVGTVQGGSAAAGAIGGAKLGAIVGTFFGPGIGTVIGGIIGSILGGILGSSIGKAINKYVPGLSAGIGKFFEGIKTAFSGVMELVTPLKDSFMGLFEALQIAFTPLTNLMKGADGGVFGTFMGMLGSIVGLIAKIAVGGIVTLLDGVISAITVVIQLLTFDFPGAFNTLADFVQRFVDRIYSLIPGGRTETVRQYQEGRREGPPSMEWGMARGGLVRGLGTSTSDSIPAMLSNGEYVLNAKAVRQIGTATLDRMNQAGTITKRAAGGPVGNVISTLPGVQRLLDSLVFLNTVGDRIGTSINRLTSSAGLGRLGNLGSLVSDKINTMISTTSAKLAGMGNNVISKGIGLLQSKSPADTNLIGAYQQGGLKGVGASLLSKGLRAIGSRNPGVSGIVNAVSAFKEGGIGGGIGKLVGGTLGSLIPIPGVGTAIGTFLGSKVGSVVSKVGSFVGGLFGRKKAKAPTPQRSIAGMMDMEGGENAPAAILPQLMAGQNLDPLTAMALAGVAPPNIPTGTQQVKIDISNLEQKFDQLIRAFTNIQINMDGNKVGNVLVNSTNAASNIGPLRTQSVPTI